jgi:hypothetical protein
LSSEEAPKITVKLPGADAQVIGVSAREFKSKSRGYFGSGKYNGPGEKRYQVTVNLVEIGSKPKPGKEKAE